MLPDTRFILLGLLAAVLIALAVWILFRRRTTPEQRERRRRLEVNRTGRMGDGMLTDIQEDSLYFSYSVRGVDYTASQDIGALAGSLPEDRSSFIGPVTLKYSPRNPANSIIVCEQWSGLRTRHQNPTHKETELR
ncbi:MAG: hypothetical protein GY953_33335 [bacterium]|nr:hypothetical protein [bacterium]